MSRGDKWVPIDKYLGQELQYINRPFSRIEAMLSYTIDQNCGKKGSIKGYAVLWQWSRNKVRKFINEIRTQQGHSRDTVRTPYRHPIHFIDKGLWSDKDTKGTQNGQDRDTIEYPTTNNNPNPNKKDHVEQKSNGTPYKEIIDFLNTTASKNYKHTSKDTQRLIKARFNAGFTLENFKTVILSKVQEWQYDDKMVQYIRPITLFGTKFESYLQASEETKSNGIHGEWK